MGNRPSNREIINKVTDALAALNAGRFIGGFEKHQLADLEPLGLNSALELPSLLKNLLREIQHADPLNCYAGTFPPTRSYEKAVKGLELWAYCWHSGRYDRMMYLKFALKKDKTQKLWYFHMSCHESDTSKGKRV